MPVAAPSPAPAPGWWPRFTAGFVGAYHAYATWLAGISWKRFFVLAVLLLVVSGVAQNLPPFNWTLGGEPASAPPVAQRPRGSADSGHEPVQIAIDGNGVRVTRGAAAASTAASAASAAADGGTVVDIRLPPGADTPEVREAVEEAKQAIREAIDEVRTHTGDAARQAAIEEATRELPRPRKVAAKIGSSLPEFAFVWIVASAMLKLAYKGRIQAEAKAAQATENAEAEALKRQVAEARMALMQAQIEPHFLFNTLASIDHLIETDPKRASTMQKNLIALLRATMPTMREASAQARHDLGRELAVVRPYLEILKVRMEERLQAEIAVPEGLLSAEFPPMMLQGLVENAIKHGLEPKAEGGRLRVAAEIVHGALAVTVADSGLGFGQAPTSGTGTGLRNLRERLQLLYGSRASLTVAAEPGGGTRVTVAVPYSAQPAAADAPAAA